MLEFLLKIKNLFFLTQKTELNFFVLSIFIIFVAVSFTFFIILKIKYSKTSYFLHNHNKTSSLFLLVLLIFYYFWFNYIMNNEFYFFKEKPKSNTQKIFY